MPLLSIEFAVFFIVFLPLVLGILHVCRKFKTFTFGCRTGLALPYRPHFLPSLILVYFVCGLPDQRADVSETRISANFGWVAVFRRH